jgi:hypothetical protein
VENLQKVLNSPNATQDEISERLEALCKARDAADTNLKKAQVALRETLTVRQQATLVLLGAS